MGSQKYNIKENKVTKIIIYIYIYFALKNKVFFCKVILMKMKIKGVIEDLKKILKNN